MERWGGVIDTAAVTREHVPNEPRTERLPNWVAPVAIVAIVVAVYARTIGYGFRLDDYVLARRWGATETIKTFWGPFDTLNFNDPYYRPLVSVSFALDWRVWGTAKWGYHLTNLALHVLVTLGVWRLIKRTTVPGWAAFAGAVAFGVIASNVATVLYMGERSDSLAALFVVGGLIMLGRYHADRRTRDLVAVNLALVLAVLSKEVGVALVPMALLFWWYLETERTADERAMASESAAHQPRDRRNGLVGHLLGQISLLWHGLTRKDGRRGWLLVGAPLIVVTAGYLAYRTAVMPAGSLGGRFNEGDNPARSLVYGVYYTFKGVPFSIASTTLLPLVAFFGLAIVLQPRSPNLRVVLLGAALVAGGVLPLTFNGGVDPRLLYVAEIGMAVAIAGALAMLGQAVTSARASRPSLATPIAIVACGVTAVAALAIGVTLVRSQNEYRPGSALLISHEVELWQNLTPQQIARMPAEYVEEIRSDLVDAGYDPDALTASGG